MSQEPPGTLAGEEGGSENEAESGARRNWEESFMALLDYKNTYGNTLVPSAYDADSALGHWVRKQRRYESSGKLPPDKRKRLDMIGFVWKLRGEHERQQQAQQQQKQKPPQHVLFMNKRNSTTTRAASTKSSRTRQREQPMSVKSTSTTSNTKNSRATGGGGTKIKRNWEESFAALVAYKDEFGHTNVSRSYSDHALGQWVGKCRRQQSKLTRKQREKLKSIGFDFARAGSRGAKDVWEENFASLAMYQEEHGDCLVDEDSELGAWVAEQRQSFLDERMPPKRAKALESIGFQFYIDPTPADNNKDGGSNKGKQKTSLSERWGVQYETLVAFYQANGHCVVPRSTHKQLSYWVQRQRQLNLNNKLKPERKEALDELNFEWYCGINELPEHYFDEMLERLSDFKSEFGHVEVPLNYMRGGLGDFVETMKLTGADGQILPEEAQKLLRLGFAWTENRDSWFKHFDRAADELEACRGADLLLSGRAVKWLTVQFMLLDYDLLPPKRVEKMDELDVQWDGQKLSLKENAEGDNNNNNNNSDSDDESIYAGAMFKAAALAWTPEGMTESDLLQAHATETQASPPEETTKPETQSMENQSTETATLATVKDQTESTTIDMSSSDAMDVTVEKNDEVADAGKETASSPEKQPQQPESSQDPSPIIESATAKTDSPDGVQGNTQSTTTDHPTTALEGKAESSGETAAMETTTTTEESKESKEQSAKRSNPGSSEANAVSTDVEEGEPMKKKARLDGDEQGEGTKLVEDKKEPVEGALETMQGETEKPSPDDAREPTQKST